MNVSSILKQYDNVIIAGVSVGMINVLCMVCIIISVVSAIFLVLLGKFIRPERTAGFVGGIIEKIGQGIQGFLFRLPHFWKEVYKFLSCEDNLIWYFRTGTHSHSLCDIQQLINVIQNRYRNKPLPDTYYKTPFEEPELIFDWKCPEK